MGIKKLNQFLSKYAPDAFVDISVADFEYQKIAIDASILMYKMMATSLKINCKKTNLFKQDLDRNQVVDTWIHLTITRICDYWLAYKMIPVFVFDGPAAETKTPILMQRYQKKLKKKEKIKELTAQIRGDPFLCAPLITDLKKELKTFIDFSIEERKLYKEVLMNLGIPCLDAVGEADQLCAMLCQQGYVKAVFSEDTDLYPYGCPLTMTGFSRTILNGYPSMKCVDLNIILTSLSLNLQEFVDVCILCGCDHNGEFKKMSSDDAYQFILKYRDIINIPMDLKKYNVEACRNEFKNKDVKELILNGSIEEIELKMYQQFDYIKPYLYKINLLYSPFFTSS